MALIDDPKVQNLVDREVKKAVSADRKRILTAIKEDVAPDANEIEDSGAKKAAKGVIKSVNNIVREKDAA